MYCLRRPALGKARLGLSRGCACQVAEAVVAAHESGELQSALETPDAYKAWVKGLGKSQKRKGKRLFMPLRVALTGNTHVRPSSCVVIAGPSHARLCWTIPKARGCLVSDTEVGLGPYLQA